MLYSVNIATYNQLPNLKLIIESLKDQTVKDFEIIVCDDGSSDGTKEWAQEQDFKYFWQEDKGFRLAKSKNNGIRAAKGDYFVSLEADVIPNYRMLEHYRLWLDPMTVLLGVRHDIETLPDKIDYDELDSNIVSYDFRLGALRQWGLVARPWRFCSGCNFLIPTKVLQDIGGWNEDFKNYGIDDYEVCLRLVMAGCKIQPVPAAYGYHLKHDLRMTPEENVEILKKLEAKYEDRL